ncbi:glutathione S-transferase family protein [Oceanicola sp. D3]|uniref:glutathione S-transferase family protein n=1 Tax=Oceanicola sp. D3 TaxID=2587163 RepID=UPI00111F2D0B|nr:glutathione S-transferase family protein [Oceanicola sp. D3]QDC10845.1 glutathione S-transferase family protein [Oceanicola sp. D3]
MAENVTLHGYHSSVYMRAARMALALKGVPYAEVEVNPFDEAGRAGLMALNPFGRVPVLAHGGFTLYETAAITGYVDRAFDGPALMPEGAQPAARAAQVIGIVDAYAYVPLVRQVFSHGVFRPAEGHQGSAEVVAEGLRVAPRVLGALEAIAAEGLVLGEGLTRADCHLAPMVDAFCRHEAGAAMLGDFPALSGWWARVKEEPVVVASDPGLPG